MKKLIKENIISFIIGILIFGPIGVYAGSLIHSNEVTFTPNDNKWNVTKVDEALNDLYINREKNYEEYDGETTITPTNETLILNTENKLLKSNIKLNNIPNSYKNLSSTTTVTADKLPTGITAYNNLGELITGTLNPTCLTGTYEKSANQQMNIDLGFTPKKFYVAYYTEVWVTTVYDSSVSSNVYQAIPSNADPISTVNTYNINSNNITTNFLDGQQSYQKAYTVYYIACK